MNIPWMEDALNKEDTLLFSPSAAGNTIVTMETILSGEEVSRFSDQAANYRKELDINVWMNEWIYVHTYK